MKLFWILLGIVLLIALLYILCLRCNRRRDWKKFQGWRYAHRGLHDKPRIPENSIPAFKRAVQCGFGAELDVHLMKDGHLAVIHDASLRRTAGADVEIEDLTAEDLQQYKLEGTEYHIPLLEEVLPIFAGKAPLIVELKAERGNADALAAAACALLDKYKGKYMVESFDPRCLMWLWHNRPQVLRGQLSENFLRHGDGANLPGVVRWVLSNLLLNCRTPQSYCTAPGQSCWHHYWVHLDGAGVAAMEPLLLPGKKLTPVQLTGVKMQEYFETVLGQMERSTVDSMVTMGLALHEMLALCAQSILAQAEATSARQVILQAAETLRKNYQKELCLADLLAEAHMSKSYFLRLFRRYMGTTPYNYLVNFRITQAKELLVLTDHSVSEIAREVGFGDASNFSTRFAKATGQSPLQYRKSALKPLEGAR